MTIKALLKKLEKMNKERSFAHRGSGHSAAWNEGYSMGESDGEKAMLEKVIKLVKE